MRPLPPGVRLEISRPTDGKRIPCSLDGSDVECASGLVAFTTTIFVVAAADKDSRSGKEAGFVRQRLERRGYERVAVEYGPPVVDYVI